MSSFQTMKKEDLEVVCDFYGIDEEHRKTKKTILEELDFQNISYSQWQQDKPSDLVQEDVEPSKDKIDQTAKHLVKMTRSNPFYQIAGLSFSKESPFALATDEQVDILMAEGGFEMATPREVKEFYG